MDGEHSENKPSHAQQLAKKENAKLDSTQYRVKFKPDMQALLDGMVLRSNQLDLGNRPDSPRWLSKALKKAAGGNLALPEVMQSMILISRWVEDRDDPTLNEAWDQFTKLLNDRSHNRDRSPPFTLTQKPGVSR